MIVFIFITLNFFSDAITGTAQQEVVDEYNRMLTNGEEQISYVQSQVIPLLITNKKLFTNTTIINNDSYLTNFEDSKTVVLLVQNLLGQERLEILHYYTNRPDLIVKDDSGTLVTSEIHKCVNFSSNGLYDLYFYANLPPLSSTTFNTF